MNLNRAHAINMESPQYQIQFGNIDIGAKSASDSAYKLDTTLGQLAAGEFSRNGFVIKAGFQYIHSIVPFTFSISNTRINLGELTPNVFATDGAVLKVSYGGAGGYQVTAAEEGPLRALAGKGIINDTACDSGCDESIAKEWSSTSTYGFGYSMAGEDVPGTFTSCGNDCYRRFPDLLTTPTPELPEIVMNSDDVTVDVESKPKEIYHESAITFKANIQPAQESGTYQTIIHFTALPSY